MNKWMVMTMCAVLGVGMAQAELKMGDLEPEVIQASVTGKARTEQRAIARQTLEAIGAMAMPSDAKLEALVTAARALIAGGKTADVIAEVFNSMPIEYLPAVANLLAEVNFDQDIQNGGKPWPNQRFDDFAAALVKSVSRYIEASGTDSPALRIGILAATFTKASNDATRTQPKVIAALPPAMQGAAAAYVDAQLNGNLELIAAAAGVDSVEETPAEDPNADRVVSATPADEATADSAADVANKGDATEEDSDVIKAETDYLASPVPGGDDDVAEDAADEDEQDAKVPLLARYTTDVLGITLDTMMSTMYDWEDPTLIGNLQPGQPGIGLDPMPGLDEQIPHGGSTRPLPSPTYNRQAV